MQKTMRQLYQELEDRRVTFAMALEVLDDAYSGPIKRAWAEDEIAHQLHETYLRRANIKPRSTEPVNEYGKGYL